MRSLIMHASIITIVASRRRVVLHYIEVIR